MKDTAIKIENLTKEYRLGTIGHGTLREDMQSAWARLIGKEDPNSLVTAKHNIESDKKHFLAIDDLNLEIKKGERLGIIGKNGAGKSTLLKILSRITSPTKGNVYVNGRIGSLLEVGTGFHPELSGRENIYLNGSIMGMKKAEIDNKFDEIVDFSGVEKFIDTPIKRYSSGMFVRLGFAVAANLDPEILIVDEVLAVGDAEFQKKAIGKMKNVSEGEGRTILFVSHNMASIKKLCNYGILIEKGKLIKDNYNLDELISYYMNGDQKQVGSVWSNNSSVGSSEFFPLKMWLTNEENIEIVSSIDISESFYLYLEFEIEIPNKLLTIAFQILLENGDVLLSSSFDDKNNSSFESGKHKVRCKIPSFFLNEGRYFITLESTIRNTQFIIEPKNREVSIPFDIQLKTSVTPYWTVKKEGLTSLFLPWETL